MKRISIVALAVTGLIALPGGALAQNKPERERVDTTFTTAIDQNFTGCTEQVHVTGNLVTTIKASGAVGGRVHNVTRVRLTDVQAVGVTSGTEYRVQWLQGTQRSYEFGGTDQYVAHANERLRVMGPGAGNDFITTVKWQYRQDQAGNIVVNDLQVVAECKKP